MRARFDDVIFIAGDVPPHRVANYVRQRVVADKVETGPVKTVFPRATVRGQPGVELAIQVVARGAASELQVRNLSLVKPTPGLSEEERWRAAGFKPDGTLLDPTHLRAALRLRHPPPATATNRPRPPPACPIDFPCEAR